MELSFRPLDGPFGMEVQGVDLSRHIATKVVHTLDTALAQHQVLLFRNQDLNDERLNEVASLFGEVRALPGGYIAEEKVFGVRQLTNLGPDNKPTGVHPGREARRNLRICTAGWTHSMNPSAVNSRPLMQFTTRNWRRERRGRE